MRAAAIGVAALGLLAGLCASVWAEGVPWTKPPEKAGENPPGEGNIFGEPKAPVPDKAALDLEKELAPALYTRAIKPIIAQMDAAKKSEGLAEKELGKPEKSQSWERVLGFKDSAAKSYLGASLRAKQSVNLVKEPTHKDAIVAQYEKPCRDNAVKLYLAMADELYKRRDIRCIAYYKRVLAIDPENETAKAELEKINKAIAEAQKANKKGAKGEGGEGNIIDIEGDISKKGREDLDPGSGIPGQDKDWLRKRAGIPRP
jgi:hypothetical protein